MSAREHTCRQCKIDPTINKMPYHWKIGHYPYWHEPCLECNTDIQRSSYGGPWKCPDFSGPEFGDCACGHARSKHAEMKQSANPY